MKSELYDAHFLASVRELSRISGRDYDELLKHQAGTVIKTLALDKRAKPPSVKKIREAVTRIAHSSLKTPHGLIRHTRNGMVYWRRSGSSKWRVVFDKGTSRGWHLSPAEWADYQAAVKYRQQWIVTETKKTAASRGLVRMTFIQMADDLHISLAKVGGANLNESIPRRARLPRRLSQATETEQGLKYEMVFKNFSQGVTGSQKRPYFRTYWQGRLQSAITRRARAISMDMRKGVFNDMQLRAKKYPGVFVTG